MPEIQETPVPYPHQVADDVDQADLAAHFAENPDAYHPGLHEHVQRVIDTEPAKKPPSGPEMLHKLAPDMHEQDRVQASARHAESKAGRPHIHPKRAAALGHHITRMEGLLSKGSAVEERVWESATKELVIKSQDIPDSYWKQQEQIARDNGMGDVHISSQQKETLTAQLQDAQRTGVESWSSYLKVTADQYPTWFKLYAWDGMSRLGTFDKTKGQYHKRDAGTVAPYPQLNPAALAKVYDTVTEYYGGQKEQVSGRLGDIKAAAKARRKADPERGQDDSNDLDKYFTPEEAQEAQQLRAQQIDSQDFNKLYSHFLLDQKAIIPTPERAEDVVGEWREYTSDDIEAINHAAEGTPWCIAGESFAKSYTQDGGKFMLFHLQDPETGAVSPTAAASIRLNGRGNVAELSGLKGGSSQYIEDALIPAVEEKTRTLPGGERYIQAFEDKQKLIAMDRKFQAGEPFTTEELMFLYETERPISYIDTYAQDPRPEQFKQRRDQHIEQLTELYGHEATARFVIMSPDVAARSVAWALQQEVDADLVLGRLKPEDAAPSLKILIDGGADVDPTEFAANRLTAAQRLQYFGQLKDAGAKLDPTDIANELKPSERYTSVETLIKLGATIDVDALIEEVHPIFDIGGLTASRFLKLGASPGIIMGRQQIGTDWQKAMSADVLVSLTNAFIKNGSSSEEFLRLFKDKLAKNEVTIYQALGGDGHSKKIQAFLDTGLDATELLRVAPGLARGELDVFLAHGADVKLVMSQMHASDVPYSADKLAAAGADINEIMEYARDPANSPSVLFTNFDKLNTAGANLDINQVVNGMSPELKRLYLKEILKHGVTIDVNQLLLEPDAKRVKAGEVAALLEAGASMDLIADKLEDGSVYVASRGRITKEQGSWLTYLHREYPELIEKLRYKFFEERDRYGYDRPRHRVLTLYQPEGAEPAAEKAA